MRPRWRIAAVAGVLALSACTAGSPDADVPFPVNDWEPGDDSMQALLTGTLEFRDGCLVVNSDYSDQPTVMVLPQSLATWDSDSSTLTYGDEVYHMGDRIRTGGGGSSYLDLVDIPPVCEPFVGDSVFTVHHDSLQ